MLFKFKKLNSSKSNQFKNSFSTSANELTIKLHNILSKVRPSVKYLIDKKIFPYIFCQKFNNENTYIIHKKNLLLSLLVLKNHINFQYKVLSSISGVDFLSTQFDKSFRFAVVYDLLTIKFKNRLRLKVFLNEISTISSSCSVYYNANWWEREVWDMYGIWFDKHPDLRRILTDYGFDGFPLRKDFPLSGYIDVSYSADKRRIISEPLELTQEFRAFTFESQW
jgi:NADH dehydrogenase (ubiquinone) Fe-S protein 3|tara:strand:+ start:961 stop:1629 length:669 start_codon:yes stop_codon:yes gene_type:complete